MNQITPGYRVMFQVSTGSHTHDVELRLRPDELSDFIGILARNSVPVVHLERERFDQLHEPNVDA